MAVQVSLFRSWSETPQTIWHHGSNEQLRDLAFYIQTIHSGLLPGRLKAHVFGHLNRVSRKQDFCINENKATAQLISAFDFATHKAHNLLFYLNQKFHASSPFLWLYRLVCVKTGRKPQRLVFLRCGSFNSCQKLSTHLWLNFIKYILHLLHHHRYMKSFVSMVTWLSSHMIFLDHMTPSVVT